jgi:hypothetical protein
MSMQYRNFPPYRFDQTRYTVGFKKKKKVIEVAIPVVYYLPANERPNILPMSRLKDMSKLLC